MKDTYACSTSSCLSDVIIFTAFVLTKASWDTSVLQSLRDGELQLVYDLSNAIQGMSVQQSAVLYRKMHTQFWYVFGLDAHSWAFELESDFCVLCVWGSFQQC